MTTSEIQLKRESDAFQKLYDANHEDIRRLLARTAGPQEAEDLAQIVFAKAARGLPKFRGDAQISTWLYRITANVASDWLRGRSTLEAKATIQLPDAIEDTVRDFGVSSTSQEKQTSPEQELIRNEMGDCIRRLIGRLPEKHRTVLVLGELGGFKDDEVAHTLGISRSNAKVRLHRARAQLKKALEAHCDFSRNEDNEFVCEPKLAPLSESSKRSGCPSTTSSSGQFGSESL
jgi:RNA polymerase sigma-70 factor (ECF subfamily)